MVGIVQSLVGWIACQSAIGAVNDEKTAESKTPPYKRIPP